MTVVTKIDYLIVGAGIFGCVLAERIANDLNAEVLIIDKRPHIGGNCYSEVDPVTGIEFHKYGTHIFHTSSEPVWNYIQNFSEFNGYHHQVLACHNNKVYQMPINLETINSFYNLNLKPFEAREFINKEIAKEGIKNPKNFEEKAISLIGRPLYEAFIKGYTKKQWNKDPKILSEELINRLPVRFNYNEDYFVDAIWQGIPLNGYSELFKRMLDSPKIHIELNCDYFDVSGSMKVGKRLIYTGPIDKYFGYSHGKLEWRTSRFEFKIFDLDDFQGTSVMNYPDLDVAYTRIHEPKHLHPERKYASGKNIVFYEFPDSDADDPFYPVHTKRNAEIYNDYRRLAEKQKTAIFCGRLGAYRYYDMDKAILAALNCYSEIKENHV